MRNLKLQLLTAAAVASISSAAFAQVALPAAELHGDGASSIANVLTQSLNCVGQPNYNYSNVAAPVPTGLNQLGKSTGSLSTITPYNYTGSPAFNCASKEIQPSFNGKYISSGSGGGKTWWKSGAPSGIVNPFPQTVAADGVTNQPWTNIQFAFSDAPVTEAELTTYNSSANAASGTSIAGAGPAIHTPFFILPVAVAYNPTYGVYKDANGVQVPLHLRLKYPLTAKDATGASVQAGGLRLDKDAYCGIYNGTITNFNDAKLTTLNGGQSLKDVNDDQTRWNTTGVPIILVGRSDKSGTTDITTRSLSAQCRTPNYSGTNYFAISSESLPYRTNADVANGGGTAGPDMSLFDSASELKPTSTAPHAGSTTRISGAFYNKGTGAFQGAAEVAGMFTVANGSDGVAGALNYQPAATLTGAANAVLNGRVGYIGADWVVPSSITGTILQSAGLLDPSTAAGTKKYLLPNAKNATTAFGAVLPPQSSSTGAFNSVDGRSVTDTINGTHAPARANPLDWLAVTHVPGTGTDGLPTTDIAGSIGDPTKGYPLTGTTQLLTSTCFKNSANRFAMVEFMGVALGKVTKDSAGTTFSVNLIKGTGTPPGVLAANGIAPMPTAWISAISETFLKKSTQASNGIVLGNLNLWMQSKIPTGTADVTGAKAVTSNPVCTAGTGA